MKKMFVSFVGASALAISLLGQEVCIDTLAKEDNKTVNLNLCIEIDTTLQSDDVKKMQKQMFKYAANNAVRGDSFATAKGQEMFLTDLKSHWVYSITISKLKID